MRVAAPAKVNLRLVVLAREASGYHQIETIFCRLALADDLVIERAERPGFVLHIEGADVGPVADNLVTRAVHAWCDAAQVPPAYTITLHKRVPAGAGLGGGSSDAAAALRALDRMHDDALGPQRLLEIGAALGSDVPFFLADSPLALAWGRGERLLPHTGPGAAPALVVVPPAPIATAGAYERLSRTLPTLPRPVRIAPDALASWGALATLACNDFERVVLPELPVLHPVIATLRAHGARIAQLTGSGAAVFGVFDLPTQAHAAATALRDAEPGLRLFRTDAGV